MMNSKMLQYGERVTISRLQSSSISKSMQVGLYSPCFFSRPIFQPKSGSSTPCAGGSAFVPSDFQLLGRLTLQVRSLYTPAGAAGGIKKMFRPAGAGMALVGRIP
jgi:hypothetical protein